MKEDCFLELGHFIPWRTLAFFRSVAGALPEKKKLMNKKKRRDDVRMRMAEEEGGVPSGRGIKPSNPAFGYVLPLSSALELPVATLLLHPPTTHPPAPSHHVTLLPHLRKPFWCPKVYDVDLCASIARVKKERDRAERYCAMPAAEASKSDTVDLRKQSIERKELALEGKEERHDSTRSWVQQYIRTRAFLCTQEGERDESCGERPSKRRRGKCRDRRVDAVCQAAPPCPAVQARVDPPKELRRSNRNRG